MGIVGFVVNLCSVVKCTMKSVIYFQVEYLLYVVKISPVIF